jgi:hypothetical protein
VDLHPRIRCYLNPGRQLGVLLIDQHVSVSSLASVQVDDCPVGILQWDLLDPWLDIPLNGQIQHVLDILGRANGAAADLDAIANDGEGVDGGKLSAVRCTREHSQSKIGKIVGSEPMGGRWRKNIPNLDEATAGLEHLEVARQGHLRA